MPMTMTMPPPKVFPFPRVKHHDPKYHIPIMSDPHGKEHGMEMGSPIVETLLTPAVAWANNLPDDHDKMIVIVSDLIADPIKYQDGCITRFSDPKTFKWSFTGTRSKIHLRFYMVDDATQNELRSTWHNSGVDMKFFEPGHTVDKDDAETTQL